MEQPTLYLCPGSSQHQKVTPSATPTLDPIAASLVSNLIMASPEWTDSVIGVNTDVAPGRGFSCLLELDQSLNTYNQV